MRLMKSRLNGDVIMPVAFLVWATIYLVVALEMPPIRDGQVGPSFIPLVLVALMYAGSITTLVQGLKRKTGVTGWQVIKKPLIVIGMMGVYAVIFKQAGYWITTSLLCFGVALLFSYGKSSKARVLVLSAIIAVITVFLGYLMFEVLFGLHLPRGVFSP